MRIFPGICCTDAQDCGGFCLHRHWKVCCGSRTTQTFQQYFSCKHQWVKLCISHSVWSLDAMVLFKHLQSLSGKSTVKCDHRLETEIMTGALLIVRQRACLIVQNLLIEGVQNSQI